MAITKVNHPDLLDLASDAGATVFPKGTTAQRPVSPEAGYIRFNTTDNVMETYDGTEWKVLDNFTPPYSVDYLVIAAGGGGGAQYAGGGGAGGYRTSYGTSGGNASAEPQLILTQGTQYDIVIGAGGAATSNSGVQAGSGQNSSFSSITSVGGGYGGNAGGGSDAVRNGGDGGSGGGIGNNTPGDATAGSGTTGQGFDGGAGQIAGGGGGAGSVGGTWNGSDPNVSGGIGLSSNITGSYITRAIGGIGLTDPSPALNGANNTGNGGGGTNAYYPSGAGGSGVVILRMPTANYSGTTTGSPTVTTDGTDTILTYTSSGTYTA